MKRRNFISVTGAGLIYTGINSNTLLGIGRRKKLRWEKSGESKLFSQLFCEGTSVVGSGLLGLLNTSCQLSDKQLDLNPRESSGRIGSLKIELQHALQNSGLGEGEDLLQARLILENEGVESLKLKVGFTTGAQPSGQIKDQKIYIPISAAGLNRESRLGELGTADFYQDCELNIGEDDFSCHYLEPMASISSERKTKALLLAPVVDIRNDVFPWRMALFTDSELAMRFSTIKDREGNSGWSASRELEIPAGGKMELSCHLLFHRGEADQAWSVFHKAAHIDEFTPPDWLSDVKVHYYDFLSSVNGQSGVRGDGYEADIPFFKDFHVGMATQHGYYPYIGDFIAPGRYEWQAMQGDPQGPAKMSLSKMKERIKATRANGSRAAIYMHTVLFDDASPLFNSLEESILVGPDGQRKKFTWKGPDTMSQNWWMSFASKVWTDHLLRQAAYIMEMLDPDAIVFDETFVCLGYEHHSDRSGPLTASSIPFWKEMRRLVHSFGEDKALLTSDCGMSNMVMWADGDAGDHSYSTLLGNPLYRREPIRYKAALGQKPWVPCSWHFLKMWEEQMDLARKINSAVGVSNGWIEFNGLHGLDADTRTRLINEIKQLY